MTRHVTRWADLPRTPSPYTMYGGEIERGWVAYVGIAGNLNSHLVQHFLRRDSSVVTGTSAVGVNIEHVRYVEWWDSDHLYGDNQRHAAELIAFDVLDPALRSRGNPRKEALEISADPVFRDAIDRLLRDAPTGRFTPPRLNDLARRLDELEIRVARLETE